MSRRKLFTGIAIIVALAPGIYFAYSRWTGSHGDSREGLLRSMPANATAVIYVDIAELRQEAILKNLVGWTTNATVDLDYKQFVAETGFDYEKDLDRVGIAIENEGTAKNYLALADGKFDRKKIEAYLRKNGRSEIKGAREIFYPAASVRGRTISVAFLTNGRIAITDAADLNTQLEAAGQSAGHAEWIERFERLAGTPLFAMIRQDAAIGALLSERAPGGMRSPQLAQLLDQLLWISIAGKPDGNQFRAVLEGECPNEATMRQLSDFLNGIALMAQSGLNDPKLRQQMDPAEREAYLQLLNSVEVAKLDRGTGKSVRVAMIVTPALWSKVAGAKPLAAPSTEQNTAAPNGKNPSSKNKKTGTKIPAKHP